MLNKNFIIPFLFIWAFHLSAQEIVVVSSNQEVFEVDLVNCSYQLLFMVDRNYSDISFSPDGRLFGVRATGEIYLIDQITGNSTFLQNVPGGTSYTSMTISAENIVYIASANGNLASFNLSSGQILQYGNIGRGATGDLTFYKGELYAAVDGDDIMRINITDPGQSQIVINENVPGEIFGVVSFAESCEDVKAYAITNGASEIYLIDFDNSSLSLQCQLDITIFGGASTFEFLSSNPIEVQGINLVPVSSCSSADGALDLAASGGLGQLTYSLDSITFQPDSLFTNLAPGNYRVYVKDENGCVLQRDTVLLAAMQPDLGVAHQYDPFCGMDNGFVELNWMGGSAPYTFSIDGVNFQSEPTFMDLPEGTYIFTIKDALDCENNITVSLQRTAEVSLDPPILTPSSCQLANGGADVSASGGTEPYEFSLDSLVFTDQTLFADLGPGSYTLYVRDSMDCTDQLNFEIISSSNPSVDVLGFTHTSCGLDNGIVVLNASGGNGPYEYAVGSNDFQSTALFENLAAGSFTFRVRDVDECETDTLLEINPSEAILIQSVQTIEPKCQGDQGQIVFELNSNSTISQTIMNGMPVSGLNFTNLTSGPYSFQFIDTDNCMLDTLINLTSEACAVFIPNVFSPNGDNINDFLGIQSESENILIERFIIFDRWGNQVHSVAQIPIQNQVHAWTGRQSSGKAYPAGVYVYFVELNIDGQTQVLKGDITLIR